MSAYLIVRVEIENLEAYSQYTARSPAIIEQYGGKFLARGGDVETLEGEEFKGRLVIVEFPSLEAARNFYDSEEYQKAKAIRLPVSEAQFYILDGI